MSADPEKPLFQRLSSDTRLAIIAVGVIAAAIGLIVIATSGGSEGKVAEATAGEASEISPLQKCVHSWNAKLNKAKQEELGATIYTYSANPNPAIEISRYEGAPYESTFGAAESNEDVGTIRAGDCIIAPMSGGTGSFFAQVGSGRWILGEYIAGGDPKESLVEPYIPTSIAETNGSTEESEPEEGTRMAYVSLE
jgi:hypothetical protein